MRNLRGLFIFALLLAIANPAAASDSVPNILMTSSANPALVNRVQPVSITAQTASSRGITGIEINFIVYTNTGDYQGQTKRI